MAERLKVVFTDDQKDVRIQTGTRILLRRCCHAILQLEDFSGLAELHIHFTDNDTLIGMPQANEDNEVAIIPAEDANNPQTGAEVFGDIYIAMLRCAELAKQYNFSFRRHLTFTVADSFFRLLGYDEDDALSADERRSKVETIMSLLGLHVNDYYYETE